MAEHDPGKPLIDEDIPGPRRDYVGYGRRLPRVSWPGGARVALSLVLNYEEGSEYSFPAGDGFSESGMAELAWSLPSQIRDLAAESVYEYGSRAGIWRLARLFDDLRAPVTVYASAVALERNPDVAAWIREAGHEACAHGWRWEQAWRLDRDEEKRRIVAAVDSISTTVGVRPRGWASRYCPSVHTRELLQELGGFVYDSDAFNDDLPYFTAVDGKRWLVVPYSLAYNDARFVVPQGHGGPDSFLALVKRGLDYLWEEGATHPKMMSIGLHARTIGQAGRASVLKEFIAYAQAKGGVWFARRIDIAEWWLAHADRFAP
jgi:peptidoglycan/xylan/chitin deacetylase (PgdA/CDA1 family)